MLTLFRFLLLRGSECHEKEPTMRPSALLAAVTLLILVPGCAKDHHYLSKKLLKEQMSSQEMLQTKPLFLVVPTSGNILGVNFAYDSNNTPKLLCYNQDDQKEYVSVYRNTVLLIRDSKGRTHRMHLDTLFLKNDVLYGLESVPMDAIERIEVHTEMTGEVQAK